MNNRELQQFTSNRLVGIEIIRFLSAIAILFMHYSSLSTVDGKFVRPSLENLPFYSFFHVLYNHGHMGVQFFWGISGFIFFYKYRESINQGLVTGKKFFILRFSRLYPLHLVTLLLISLLQLLYPHLTGHPSVLATHNSLFLFILQLFMASNWGFEKTSLFAAEGIYSFNGVIWSVSVEILVYFIFFMLLRYVSKSIFVNIIIICFFTVLAVNYEVFSCMVYFYTGGLSAIATKFIKSTKKNKDIIWISWVFVIVTPIFIWSFALQPDSIFYLLYIPVCLFCFSQELPLNNYTKKTIETAGNLTYSSYLLHCPMQIVISLFFFYVGIAVPIYNPFFFIAYMATMLILSYYTYRYFEVPVQNIIRKKLL